MTSTAPAATNGLAVTGGTFTGGTGSLTLSTGSVSLTAGTFTAPSGGISVGDDWSELVGCTYDPNGATVTFIGTAGTQTLAHAETGAQSLVNVNHTGTALLQVLTSPLELSGTLTNAVGAGNFDGNALAVTVAGLVTMSGGNYLASTALQTLNGGLLVNGGTFTGATGPVTVTDVTISSGTLTAPSTGAFNVSGNWLKSGGTFNPNGGTVTFNLAVGTQTVDCGGTAFNGLAHVEAGTLQPVASPLLVGGGLTNSNGVFDANGLAVTVTGLTTVTLGTYSAGTGTQTLTGGLMLSGGSFLGSTGTVNSGSVSLLTGTLSTSTAPFNVSGNWVRTAPAGFFPGGGTVTFVLGAGTQTVDGGGLPFNHVEHSGAGTLQLAADIDIGGNLTQSSGTFDANTRAVTVTANVAISSGTFTASSATIALAGNWSMTGGTFAHNGGTVTFNGAGAQALGGGGATFNNLNNAGTGTVALAVSDTAVAGTLTVATTFDVVGRTLTMQSAASFAGAGTLAVGAGGTLNYAPAAFTLPTAVNFNATSTVNYNRAGDQTMRSGITYGNLTVSGSGTKAPGAGDPAVAGTLSVSGTATFDLATRIVTLSSATAAHTVATGATLSMVASGGAAPTLSLTAGASLTVNGTLSTSGTAPRPILTAATPGGANVDLLGATVDVNGLQFANGDINGLEVGKNGGTDSTVMSFRSVDFAGPQPGGGRYLTYTASESVSMVAIACSFANVTGAANVRVVDSPNPSPTTYATAVIVRCSGLGMGEGDPDEDSDGAGPASSGWCEWVEGGDGLTRVPGPTPPGGPGYGEDRTVGHSDPGAGAHVGVQGFMTAQYNWWNYNFVGNYSLVRSEEDLDSDDDGDLDGAANGTKEDLVYALDELGAIKTTGAYATTNPFRVPRTRGRVIGPPWTATLGPPAGPWAEVVMFATTSGYIYVIEDDYVDGGDGVRMRAYAAYNATGALRPRNATTYADNVCDSLTAPLMFDAVDFEGGNADDRFYVCGGLGADTRVYVASCWDVPPGGTDERARCVSGVWGAWPVSTGTPPSRSWPAIQFLAGKKYLHFGSDYDGVAGRSRLYRIDLDDGSINQEYSGNPGEPGNHIRGGIQMLDDPAVSGDAQLYLGCFEDSDVGDQASFFGINTDSTIPGAYTNIAGWTPNPLSDGTGQGDVDSYATFDDAQIYVGDSVGDFYRIDRLTGATVLPVTTIDPSAVGAARAIRSAPTIPVYFGGPVYVGNDNGKVVRIDRATGAIERTYHLGDQRKVRSLAVVGDAFGYVYVCAITHDGYVFLIRVA